MNRTSTPSAGTDQPVVDLATTRRTLHGIAEHIFSAERRRRSGAIELTARQGGFATLPADPVLLALQDGELIRRPGTVTVPLAGTFQDLADALGVEFGMPDPPYPPASGVAAADPVLVDPVSLDILVSAWSRGDQALRRLAAQLPAGPAPEPVIWPEHFDIAIELDQVNYGVSPGDSYHAEPYAYVGPWTKRSGPFWNAPFGALRAMRELADVDAVVAFFAAGRTAAHESPLPDAPR